jgi:hypothetical protein
MKVFLAGGTGMCGRELVPLLTARGHHVRALARSAGELPPDVESVTANPVDSDSFARFIKPCDAYVLVMDALPEPLRKAEFHSLELAAVRASLKAAAKARVSHFVYAAVPTRSMRKYVIQAEAERMVRESGLFATVLRCGDLRSVESRRSLFKDSATPDENESPDRGSMQNMLSNIVAAVETPPQNLRVIISSPPLSPAFQRPRR